jgi:hypothetical protein
VEIIGLAVDEKISTVLPEREHTQVLSGIQPFKWLSVIPCRLMKADGTVCILPDGKTNRPLFSFGSTPNNRMQWMDFR